MLVSKAYLLVCKDFEIFHPHFLSGEAEMGGLCLRLSFFSHTRKLSSLSIWIPWSLKVGYGFVSHYGEEEEYGAVQK